MAYQLFYWPQIPGRGEFVRLALEAGGADYADMARRPEVEGGGIAALIAAMTDKVQDRPPFAPPFLKDGALVIAQTANILHYLGPKLGLAPGDEADRAWLNQLQLTIADLVAETHDVHHPVGVNLYYEDQKPEAGRKAEGFLKERVPKYLDYFEAVLARRKAGAPTTYVDLSLFHVLEGLRYAFPKATVRAEHAWPGLVALHDAVAALPRIAAYLASERRIPFNEMGVFRHYPELDV